MDLTSSESDLSDLSTEDERKDRGNFLLDPKSAKGPEVDRATFAWVSNLMAVRKNKLQLSPEDHGFRTTGKGWLQDQHKALEKGTIPVTYKCILAASGVSRLYNKCRDEFRQPQYRSRYWNWSVNFILLIDFYIEKGNINVTESSPKKYHALIPFLSNCKNQKSLGHLSAQREQLLTALGVTWDDDRPAEEDDESSDSSGTDNIADETWEMPASNKSPTRTRPKRRVPTRRTQPRRPVVNENPHTSKRTAKARSPSPLLIHPNRNRKSLAEWGRKMFELRHHFKKSKGTQESYDFPHDKLPLKVWMHAEVARGTTGALSSTCCAILQAAELLDPSDAPEIDEECVRWGRGFIAYVDYVIRKGSLSLELAKFMFDCCCFFYRNSLPIDRDSLLGGVNVNWCAAKEMEKYKYVKETRRSERGFRDKNKRALIGREGEEDGNPPRSGHVVEVLLDSGSVRDDRPTRKKRKKSALLVTKMLSSMIEGEVAVAVEGRTRTRAERDAKEWVLRAGAKDFDIYGRNWFREAVAD